MEAGDREQDALYAGLTEAIMKAISESPEVQRRLGRLQRKGLVHRESVFNLLISLDELSALMDLGALEEAPYKMEPAPRGETAATPECIDGKPLSRNEKKFEEFFQAIFNERDWLRKLRIRL